MHHDHQKFWSHEAKTFLIAELILYFQQAREILLKHYDVFIETSLFIYWYISLVICAVTQKHASFCLSMFLLCPLTDSTIFCEITYNHTIPIVTWIIGAWQWPVLFEPFLHCTLTNSSQKAMRGCWYGTLKCITQSACHLCYLLYFEVWYLTVVSLLCLCFLVVDFCEHLDRPCMFTVSSPFPFASSQ